MRITAADMSIVKVNPRRARRFAQAAGELAKTDALDATMLAGMGGLEISKADEADVVARPGLGL